MQQQTDCFETEDQLLFQEQEQVFLELEHSSKPIKFRIRDNLGTLPQQHMATANQGSAYKCCQGSPGTGIPCSRMKKRLFPGTQGCSRGTGTSKEHVWNTPGTNIKIHVIDS